MRNRTPWILAGAVAMAAHAAAAPTADQDPGGDRTAGGLMDKVRASDFTFSRAESYVPFIPVVSLSASAYGKTVFQNVDGSGEDVEFRSTYAGAYAVAPLFIGRRELVVAVPYVSHTRFTSLTDGLDDHAVDSFYLPVGGAWQSDSGRQWGGFVMPSIHSPFATDGEWATDVMAGVLGRSFSGERAVWYYGLVYDYSFGADVFYPYVGYSYQFDAHWVFSLIAPWPTLAYAPSDRFFVRAGVMPSGATWTLDQGGREAQVTGSFGGWDLGVYGGWRLNKVLWLGGGVGFSGLRSLQFDESGDVRFEQELGREPFVNVSLTVRPN